MAFDEVILVDKSDRELGRMEKLEAHKQGKLHRAFSIFVFNKAEEFLLQKRAGNKYHSGGLWTNTCCSHPQPGESVITSAKKRLKYEMGFDCKLDEAFKFIYKAEFENNLIEYELDHVLIGKFDSKPKINRDEVEDWKYVSLKDLKIDLQESPEHYTYWFKIAIEKLMQGGSTLVKFNNT